MDDTSITSEIHRLIDDKIASGVLVQTHWIAHEVLGQHDDIEGDDADWYRVCTFKEVCRIAKSAIGKYRSDEVTNDQLILPGFTHLCKAYPLSRDAELVLVPVDQCTDDELLTRAAELDKMAKGCVAHARELREYVNARCQMSMVA
jgi:hypothetical protein